MQIKSTQSCKTGLPFLLSVFENLYKKTVHERFYILAFYFIDKVP